MAEGPARRFVESFLKKIPGHTFRGTTAERYAQVKTFAVEFPVAELCQALDVSRSGYYVWLKRQPSQRQLRNQALLLVISELYRQSRSTYGSPRITRDRVARLMRQAGLRACQSPAFRPRTTDSDHSLPVAANLLNENGPPTSPTRFGRAISPMYAPVFKNISAPDPALHSR